MNTATSVYRYYDTLGILIYVGVTAQGSGRNQQHNKDKAWWPLVVSQTVDHFPSRESALARESELIRSYRPPYNIQHNPTRGSSTLVYEAFRASGVAEADPLPLFTACKHKIPVDPFAEEYRHGRRGYRTRLDHIPIAIRLALLGSKKQKWLISPAGVKLGEIKSIRRVGPFAEILVFPFRKAFWFEPGFALLKCHKSKAVIAFDVLHIQLRHSEEAAS